MFKFKSENLFRNIKNSKNKPNIGGYGDKEKRHIKYLKCCSTSYENLILSKDKYITCQKCFISYKLGFDEKHKVIILLNIY